MNHLTISIIKAAELYAVEQKLPLSIICFKYQSNCLETVRALLKIVK